MVARLAGDPFVSEFLVTKSGCFSKAWHNAAWRPNPLHDTIFAFCVDGQAWVGDMTNPKAPRMLIEPGEVLIVPPNTPHSYGADEKNPWDLWFHAIGPRVARILAELKVTGQSHKGRLTVPGLVKNSIERINELRHLRQLAFPCFLNVVAPLCQGRVRYDQQIFGFFQPTFGD